MNKIEKSNWIEQDMSFYVIMIFQVSLKSLLKIVFGNLLK